MTFIGLTLVGIMASFGLFAKGCEWSGLLDLVGWTFQGVIVGGLCLVVVGLLSTLFLARDVATWALKGVTAAAWDQDLPQKRGLTGQWLVSVLPYILNSCNWCWAEPRLCIFPSKELNAVALSVGRGRSLILVSSALLERATEDQVKAALKHSVLRLKSGQMTGLVIMYGMMIAMTLFPARMMALILGTSLRSAEEETPSDEVETLMLFVHEVCLVVLGSLCMRYFARRATRHADKQICATEYAKEWLQLLEMDAVTRCASNREKFTAPFCLFEKVRRFLTLWSYTEASSDRLVHLKVALDVLQLGFLDAK
jgi:Zn-dependent protease with chaperone function